MALINSTEQQSQQLTNDLPKLPREPLEPPNGSTPPPPIEGDDDVDMPTNNTPGNCGISCTENIVLAPPPQFCDCNDLKAASAVGPNPNRAIHGRQSGTNPRVRIVATVPKANRLHSQ